MMSSFSAGWWHFGSGRVFFVCAALGAFFAPSERARGIADETPIVTVEFDANFTQLGESDKSRLASILKGVDKNRMITARGYACYIEDSDHARRVAAERAEALAEYLRAGGWRYVSERAHFMSCQTSSIGRIGQVVVGDFVGAEQRGASVAPSIEAPREPTPPEAQSAYDRDVERVTSALAALLEGDQGAESSGEGKKDIVVDLREKGDGADSVSALSAPPVRALKAPPASPPVRALKAPPASPPVRALKAPPAAPPVRALKAPPAAPSISESERGVAPARRDDPALVELPARADAPAPVAPGTEPAPVEEELINIDFVDVEIKEALKVFAEVTKRDFIIDPKVKGKITIISPRSVNIGEALKILESALEISGLTLVEAGEIYKVTTAEAAKRKGAFQDRLGGERIETRLVQIKTVKARDLAAALRPLAPTSSYINAYVPTNTLIIADYSSNIQKMLSIIERLDTVENQEAITVVRIKYGKASQITRSLNSVFKSGDLAGAPVLVESGEPEAGATKSQRPVTVGSSASKPRLIADDRINVVVVVASPSSTRQIVKLINQLDAPLPTSASGIHVYYLKNAEANEIAKVVNNLLSRAGLNKQSKEKRSDAPGQIEGQITVIPDPTSNAVVVTASSGDYRVIRSLIEKLDIRRRQVFVETLIMELATSKQRDLGVEWRLTRDFTSADGAVAVGGQNFDTINNFAVNPVTAQPLGLAVGVIDGVLEYNGVTYANVGALARALQKDSDVNILSTPNILTTDNKEAEIIVASEVPLGGKTTITSTGNTIQSIERKNIGLTLKIKPQITDSEDLRLDIFQEISSIAPVQLERAKDIITTKRSLRSTVLARDKQNVVLGGLLREDETDGVSKIPLLGDIPLLGWLFRTSSRKREKTNLVLFMTPHIIREASDIEDLTSRAERLRIDERMRERYNNARAFHRGIISPMPSTAPSPAPAPVEPNPLSEWEIDKNEPI